MLYTVTASKDNGWRPVHYRMKFEADTPEAAIEKMKRWYPSFVSAEYPYRFTARPFRPRRQHLEAKIADQDREAHNKSGDDNACTCWSLARAVGVPFADAQAALDLLGRKRGHGFQITRHLNDALDFFGYETRPGFRSFDGYLTERRTLRRFREDNRSGRFLVVIRGHALALVDGQYFDNARSSDLCRVVWAARIFPKQKAYISETAGA